MVDEVIRHEFGHLITAKVLGFKTGPVELKESSANAEITLDITLPAIDDVASYIERRIQVLYAGAIAECLRKNNTIDAPATKNILLTTATDDFSKIREIMRIVAGIQHSNASKDEFQGYLTAAEKSLSNKACAIVLAEASLVREMTTFFLAERRRAALKGKPPLAQYILSAQAIDTHPSIVARFGAHAT